MCKVSYRDSSKKRLETNAINLTIPNNIGINNIVCDNSFLFFLVIMYDRDNKTEISRTSNNDQIPFVIKLWVKGFTSISLPVEIPLYVVISSPRTPVINIIELVLILVR